MCHNETAEHTQDSNIFNVNTFTYLPKVEGLVYINVYIASTHMFCPTGDLVERTVMQLAVSTSSRNDATSSGSSGSLLGGASAARYMVSETHAGDIPDIHSMATWPGVAEDLVLLQPHEARTSWREFVSTSNVIVQQVSTQAGTQRKCAFVLINTHLHAFLTCGLNPGLQMTVQSVTQYWR